jgi:colicin import membrane protein
MAGLPPTLLVRRGQRLHWAVALSAALHVVGIGGALVLTRQAASAPLLDRDREVIVAKLVRLGEERERHLLPRKEAPTPPPPPPPQATAPPEPQRPAEPEPVAPKAVIPTKEAPQTPPPETKRPERPREAERSDPGPDLDAAIRRVLGDPDTAPDDGPRYGSPDGHPDGDAAEASEGDRYLALVERALRDHYRLPNIISDRERMFLNATVVIYVAPDGRIMRREIERPSGNSHFDAALLRAVDAASPLPPPPRGWARRFERDGLGLNFRL